MVTIKFYNESHSEPLAIILRNDTKLQQSMGSNFLGSTEDFHKKTTEWINKTNSFTYSIVSDDTPIGLISLSNYNPNNKTARIGYWISSEYWNREVTSTAFNNLLEVAKSKSIKTVSSHVENDNIASMKIWDKHNCTKRPYKKGLTECAINLS
ncbi:MAG: GNAT family N-acetyltransferase [Candidatus Marinimicrobia bacterium]|jgi:[ribosomal protein S5]-alanine N-acetyltransferase|nr:GNAT family N-acetyltransferase [Candidatus Neomarinimicrobiota bacterium]MBT3760942.1 GNAT family N-acetyltransferase [Candidatus Neomarinimicrobiota bacterium]MBT3896985.1 GNAT family N-acetyltransferase [Candidatus Neomarinimicrobiota bacterium]MBT4173956.1 GNAT family N-acetyltransferase [Candidatus Neomarinimicrobiota bacterium]MBT4538636.1 GNAT family N-acetyltransferase [Candidatus Neomarinimicrobiota bacterium]